MVQSFVDVRLIFMHHVWQVGKPKLALSNSTVLANQIVLSIMYGCVRLVSLTLYTLSLRTQLTLLHLASILFLVCKALICMKTC